MQVRNGVWLSYAKQSARSCRIVLVTRTFETIGGEDLPNGIWHKICCSILRDRHVFERNRSTDVGRGDGMAEYRRRTDCYQGKSIIISNILLREVSSRHSDELNVLEFKLYAKNRIEDKIYFDVMLIAAGFTDQVQHLS